MLEQDSVAKIDRSHLPEVTWKRICCLGIIIFFFNDTATTEIYTLSLHDALPISFDEAVEGDIKGRVDVTIAIGSLTLGSVTSNALGDRKSTRLNSSHWPISYAVFCLKKKIIFIVNIPQLI